MSREFHDRDFVLKIQFPRRDQCEIDLYCCLCRFELRSELFDLFLWKKKKVNKKKLIPFNWIEKEKNTKFYIKKIVIFW